MEASRGADGSYEIVGRLPTRSAGVKAVDADNNSIAGVTVNPVPLSNHSDQKNKDSRIEPVMVGQPAATGDNRTLKSRDTILIYGEETVLQTIDSMGEQVSLAGMDKNTSISVGLIMPEGCAG